MPEPDPDAGAPASPEERGEAMPAPPEGLAKRVWEPLQAQTVYDLERVIDYCEELIEHKERPVSPDETVGAGEVAAEKPPQNLSREKRRAAKEEFEEMSTEQLKEMSDDELTRYGHLQIRKIPCGPGCNGCPHGPYRYTVYRDLRGKVTSKYAGKAGEE
ncbi:MAG: hypothetical protein ACI8VE_000104 [Natrialbaceae archaeon]|jgi:hypothetical protein